MEKLSVSRTTAAHLVDDFVGLGILHQTQSEKKRYRLFSYEAYLSILREGSEPL